MNNSCIKGFILLLLVLTGIFQLTAQDNTIISDKNEFAEFEVFMRDYLSTRSRQAAGTGNCIIVNGSKYSDTYYWKPRFDQYEVKRDKYLVFENNWTLDLSPENLELADKSPGGNSTDVITQYFSITIHYHGVTFIPEKSIDILPIDEEYSARYQIIKINGEYKIRYDGYIPGYQYIFESDLEALLERRRATLALDEPIPPAPQEFKGTKGIVTGKNVAVRNVPGIQGTVVGSVCQKQLVDIQEYAGSGNMMDGIWDYWARIGVGQWINASWVFETPFYFKKPNDISSIFYEVSTIKDDNVNASSRAIDCVGYSTVSKEDMTLRSVNLDENNLYRGLYLISHIWKLQMKDSQLADAIAAVIDDKYYKGPDPSIPLRGVRYENGGISVDVLPYMENEIEGFTIITPEVPLFFGVRVGMTRDEVCSILGKPLMNMSDIVEYQYNKELRLRFLFTDGILTAVVFNHYL